MAQPLPYERDFDFESYQAGAPSTPLPGLRINQELDQVAATIDEVLARIAQLQDDDNRLKRLSVGFDQLAPEVRNGFTTPTVWATGVQYVRGASVYRNQRVYAAVSAHVSSAFATDLANGRWVLLADFTELTVVSQGVADNAAAAAAAAANALSYRDSALSAKSDAEAAATVSSAVLWAAVAARDLAELWASEDEDVVVAGGRYSALHWAQKAEATVAGKLSADQNLGDLVDPAAGRDNLGLGSAAVAALIDDDTFATASSSNINSAEATKAYADTKVAIVADRTALKLVDTTAITIAVVKDGARSGVYLWDGTVPIATHQKWTGASFTERQYVAPNASADGAWVLLSGLNSGADSHQFYGNRLDLTESNDATAITPALFLRKNSSAGVNGMGLAKIQWRGTDDAGNRDIDAGRFDAVMTNADEDDFTARMSVSPHVKGNDENIAVMSWDDGVLVSAGSSIHALTSISGGSGYAVGDRIALVSALAGQLGVAEVVTAPAGVIASVLFRNRGYGYANAETVTFSAITGTGTGGSATVVRGRSTFPQGFGTVNAARGYYIGDSPVLLLSPDASFVTAAFEYLTLRDGVNALFNYGNGIANLATALYIRNLDTLRVSSGGTQVNRSRIIGKRVITYTSDTTLGALYNVVFVNATSGNVTLTLPAANAWGANMSPDILIRRIDGSGNTVTIQRGGSDTLNGGTSETIAAGIARRYNTNGVTAWYSNGLAA
jgi:hypothetical protein